MLKNLLILFILSLSLNVSSYAAELLTVSIDTNHSAYISGDTHTVSIDISNPESTAVIVDVYLAMMFPNGELLFVRYDLLKNTATFSSPISIEDTGNWPAAVSNLTLPAGMKLKNFDVLSQVVSDLDPFGQYTWYIGLTRPGTKTFISNIASSSYLINSIANFLVGSWSGTWIDTVFDVQGMTDITINRNGNTITTKGSINLQTIFLPEASGTATATIIDTTGNSLTFPFGAALLGSGTGSIIGRTFSGTGAILPSIGFGSFNFQGNIVDDNTIKGSFTFTNTGTGAGTFIMSKK